MTSFAANLEARHAALLAAAECADASAADLLAFAAALRQQADRLRTLELPPVSTAGTPPHGEPSPALKTQRRAS